MRKLLLGSAVLALLTVVTLTNVDAQLPANEVYVNVPFKLAWTHDGTDTTDYAVFRDGVQLGLVLVSARVGVEVQFPQTLTAPGSFTYRCDARGPGGTTSSPAFTLIARAAPTAPAAFGPVRIIRLLTP